jgi:hypothetical protein
MKRIVVLALAAAALALPASEANADSTSAPTAAQFKALQKQVKALQAQVKTLQKWVPTACTAKTCFTLRELSGLADFTFTGEVCQEAVLADEFQATWNVIDQISAATQAGKTYFGAQTSISDSGACALLPITRPSVIPPTVAIFSSFVSLLTS